MNAALESLRQTGAVAWLLMRAAALNLYGHWALAVFSVFGAFVIWVVIQDVENPRVQGVVPPENEQAIQVEFVNGSADFVPVDTPVVRVLVEAREGSLEELRASDFRATVDLQGLQAGETLSLPVNVTAEDDSVRVIEVQPARVEVQLAEVVRKEMQVQLNTGPVAQGFEIVNQQVTPPVVMVSGREDLVDNVARVVADVNISGRRTSFETTVSLQARNANGQQQVVTISPREVTVQFDIQATVSQQDFRVKPSVTGSPAPGFIVTGIDVQPPFVRVTAPEGVLDGISELVLDPIDLGGATTNVTRTRQVPPPQNTSLTPAEVSVTVFIEPIVCGPSETEVCGSTTWFAGIRFRDQPPGLAPAPGQYLVPILVSGPLPAIADLSIEEIDASVSLAGATAGTRLFTVDVTVPEGLTARPMQDLSVTLVGIP